MPPVGWHNTCMHPPHCTTVWAWLNTVVLWTKQAKGKGVKTDRPRGHKEQRGSGDKRVSRWTQRGNLSNHIRKSTRENGAYGKQRSRARHEPSAATRQHDPQRPSRLRPNRSGTRHSKTTPQQQRERATRGESNVHGEAPGALDIHEERVGRLYKPLQLVLLGLDRGVRVQEVTLKSLRSAHTQNIPRSEGNQAGVPSDMRCR